MGDAARILAFSASEEGMTNNLGRLCSRQFFKILAIAYASELRARAVASKVSMDMDWAPSRSKATRSYLAVSFWLLNLRSWPREPLIRSTENRSLQLSVLIALGGESEWRTAPEATPTKALVVMDQVSQPLTTPLASTCLDDGDLRPESACSRSWIVWTSGFPGIILLMAGWLAAHPGNRLRWVACAGWPHRLPLS